MDTIFRKLQLAYGAEWYPVDTRLVMLDFAAIFVGIFFVIVFLMTKRPKVGFHTIAFFFATSLFLALSMVSVTYWYFTYPVGLVFLIMFFSDYCKKENFLTKQSFICVIGIILILKAFIIKEQDSISKRFIWHIKRNLHYERIADWMNRHIPSGEIIYHTSWSDSPYFIGLNPKNYYLTVLDPVYMYCYDKEIYKLYNNLSNGLCNNPADILKKAFKTRYGYVEKRYRLYDQIKNDREFNILFDDDRGAIFQLI